MRIKAMTDEPRILTDAETATRRAEQASHHGRPSISLCAEPGCPRASWASHHGPQFKAAPLFLIAMDWLTTQQLANMGIELGPGGR